MKRIISLLLVIQMLQSIASGWDERRFQVEEDMRIKMITKDYCSVEEFTDLDYYLFCYTSMNKDETDTKSVPAIIGNNTQDIDAAKALYHDFRDKLPLEDDSGDEWQACIDYVSPDCRWVIVCKRNGHMSDYDAIWEFTLFYDKEKKMYEVSKAGEFLGNLWWIVENGDVYQLMEKSQQEKLEKLAKERYGEGYYDMFRVNKAGTLLAGVKKEGDERRLVIRQVEDGADVWSLSLQPVQEMVWDIREDIEEGEERFMRIVWFEGNKEEGTVIIQNGPGSFFEISYPSGEISYMGEHLYSWCLSPDGKYAAYSSEDEDSAWSGMSEEEEQSILPGIYIREMETGKTAYMFWNPAGNYPEEGYMRYRSFQWVEKEAFEEYMSGDDE